MIKKNHDIKILATSYFAIGAFNLFVGISDKSNIVFLVIGFICTILGIGLYRLWNLIRITAITISSFFVFIYVMLIIGTIMNQFEGWGGLGLLFNFPILALSLYAIDILMHPNIKQQFLKK